MLITCVQCLGDHAARLDAVKAQLATVTRERDALKRLAFTFREEVGAAREIAKCRDIPSVLSLLRGALCTYDAALAALGTIEPGEQS